MNSEKRWRKKLGSIARKFARDESGQSTTEYILILSVVVMLAMKLRAGMKDKLQPLIDNVFKGAESFTEGAE